MSVYTSLIANSGITVPSKSFNKSFALKQSLPFSYLDEVICFLLDEIARVSQLSMKNFTPYPHRLLLRILRRHKVNAFVHKTIHAF